MKILGVDWGRAHIGLALGDSDTGLADLRREVKAGEAKEAIVQICREENIGRIVVGVSENKSAAGAEKLASELEAVGLNVDLADETLSTVEARGRLGHFGRRRRSSKKHSAAAAVFLEQWLDEQGGNVV